MHHADDAEAQRVIGDFAERCRAERIPISAIHFGSGYSSRGKRRYVFTWNKAKFPDPQALSSRGWRRSAFRPSPTSSPC